MKEFNKIYLAKYESVLTTRQLAEDLRTTQKEITNRLNNLKANGVNEVYKEISDFEWENLEKLKDEQIKIMYFKKSKILQEKLKKEILNKIEVIGINSKQEYGIDLEKVNEAKKELEKPFEYEEKLKEMLKRQREINQKLNMDEKEKSAIIIDEEENEPDEYNAEIGEEFEWEEEVYE